MKRMLVILLIFVLALWLAACGSPQEPSSQQAGGLSPDGTESAEEQSERGILIAYDSEETGVVARAAALLEETLGGTRMELSHIDSLDTGSYEFVLLGFYAQNSVLPENVQTFLEAYDFGARTIYPFVFGEDNDAGAVFSAISQLQPGALLGNSALLLSRDTGEEEIAGWAETLGLSAGDATPAGEADTVATAEVTPDEQQVLYLWEEGNAPAVTVYTENNAGYFDDPDFRPYVTSFPVPEGVAIKGAVLICPGGAFQFRSDQPEGVEVAEALSARGYRSFVVDYRLRPYTQQEGALDLARAVRFVRAHAAAYGIEEADIAVMGFSAGGILSGEMLLNFDGQVNGSALDPHYVPDALDTVSADAAACGMIYSFYGRLSVGTTDVELLRAGNLPPTFYCYGTRDPFYTQFLANADAAETAGVQVERLQLDDMPHGFGADGGWISAYDAWLTRIFSA